MRLVSIDHPIHLPNANIDTVSSQELNSFLATQSCDYLIVTGGDGSVRRLLQCLDDYSVLPPIIIHPKGSFNVLARTLRLPPLETIVRYLQANNHPHITTLPFYMLNDHPFLFSAGNMGDLQHIVFSETLRISKLQRSIWKYLIALILLLPAHIILTPFFLFHPEKFFFFGPLKGYLKQIGNFRTTIEDMWHIPLSGSFHLVELDGDIVCLNTKAFHIKRGGEVRFVSYRNDA